MEGAAVFSVELILFVHEFLIELNEGLNYSMIKINEGCCITEFSLTGTCVRVWFSAARLLRPFRDIFMVWGAWADYHPQIYSCLSLPGVPHSLYISTRKFCTCFSAVAGEHRSYRQRNLQGKQGQRIILTVPCNPAGGDDCKIARVEPACED